VLLTDLYAAPLQPEKWSSFLNQLCALTDSSCGYVMGAYQKVGNVILAGGGQSHDPEFFRLYSEHYSSSDPFRPGLANPPVVGLNHGAELVNQAVVRKTEFYNELLMQYDMEHMSLLLCSFGEERTEGLSLWRSRTYPSLSDESEHLLRMLLPHVQMVLALRSRINSAQSHALFSEAVMDSMSVASLLVDGYGRVQHMNRQAELHLAKGNGLLLANGRLRATDRRDMAQLGRLLEAVTSSDRVNAVPGGAMRVTRRNAIPLHVSVVQAPAEKTFDDRCQYAIVFLYDQSMPQATRSAAMRQLYQMTPAEARMADLLCSGLTIKEASERCGVKLETARFQVKQILSKTGLHRQAELMRLMLSLPGTPEEPLQLRD